MSKNNNVHENTPGRMGLTPEAEGAMYGDNHCSAPSCRCVAPCDLGPAVCDVCDGYGCAVCPECEGTSVVVCSECDGHQRQRCILCDGTGMDDLGFPCGDCDGLGYDDEDQCLVCDGGLVPCSECGDPDAGLVECSECDGRGVLR